MILDQSRLYPTGPTSAHISSEFSGKFEKSADDSVKVSSLTKTRHNIYINILYEVTLSLENLLCVRVDTHNTHSNTFLLNI